MKFLKKNWSTILLVLIFIIGLCLLVYPSFSDYWNSFHQSRAIASYADVVADMSDEQYEEMIGAARDYNRSLAESGGMKWIFSDEDREVYDDTLNISGTGIMGYIQIDKINCSLPIYHGTSEGVLQIAIGHIEGSSLPVGGESTHCVLSGHRGLPSARLFTDLDQLIIGDTFIIRTLDETMTYEVDQVLIVEPDDLSALTIEEGKDLCTLITCTPYGINTHRLLVRGHRVENADNAQTIRITADGIQIEPIIVAPMVAAPILLLILIWTIQDSNRKRDKRRRQRRLQENDPKKGE